MAQEIVSVKTEAVWQVADEENLQAEKPSDSPTPDLLKYEPNSDTPSQEPLQGDGPEILVVKPELPDYDNDDSDEVEASELPGDEKSEENETGWALSVSAVNPQVIEFIGCDVFDPQRPDHAKIGFGRPQCHMCLKQFASKKALGAHQCIYSSEKKVQCPFCLKGFKQQCQLKVHVMTHTGEKRFFCKTCNKGFIHECHLKAHQITHTGERRFQCMICFRKFGKKNNLHAHLETHTVQQKNYRCQVCFKCFARQTDLNRHFLIHTGQRNFPCTSCHKQFVLHSDLKRHLLIHTGERNYKCADCSLSFVRRGDLMKHVQTHIGEKKFQCEICNKCFLRQSCLRRHILTHTGEASRKKKGSKEDSQDEGSLHKELENTGSLFSISEAVMNATMPLTESACQSSLALEIEQGLQP